MQEPKIIRSDRKTLSLTVTREGEVVVRAPKFVSDGEIVRFVRKNFDWVEKRLEAVQNARKLDLSDGAQLVLFDRAYTIFSGRSRISDSKLFLPESGRERALCGLIKKLALEEMSALTARIAQTYGFRFQKVRISSARGRWGSCSRDRVIAYSFRIAFVEGALREYVAVHELAHTVCFSHNGEFWEVVGSILPDWKQRRKKLKSSGVMQLL